MAMRLVQLLLAPPVFKTAGVILAGVGAAVLAYALVRAEASIVRRALSAYADYLDRRLRSLFLRGDVRALMIAQAVLAYVLIGAALALHDGKMAFFALLIGVMPAAILELKLKRRIAAIEAQTDRFVLALANALKATPSVGDAFVSLVPLTAEPLRSEIELAAKQMRLGCALEDALLQMATRVGSRIFDTALASALIGQRVGGNLPRILETSAEALRELARLEAMMRARTASGRIQMWVIAAAPVLFVVYFDKSQPGYFDPMTASTTGIALLGTAVVLWLVAIVLGKKILGVDV
jgi:tight adherence protein B